MRNKGRSKSTNPKTNQSHLQNISREKENLDKMEVMNSRDVNDKSNLKLNNNDIANQNQNVRQTRRMTENQRPKSIDAQSFKVAKKRNQMKNESSEEDTSSDESVKKAVIKKNSGQKNMQMNQRRSTGVQNRKKQNFQEHRSYDSDEDYDLDNESTNMTLDNFSSNKNKQQLNQTNRVQKFDKEDEQDTIMNGKQITSRWVKADNLIKNSKSEENKMIDINNMLNNLRDDTQNLGQNQNVKSRRPQGLRQNQQVKQRYMESEDEEDEYESESESDESESSSDDEDQRPKNNDKEAQMAINQHRRKIQCHCGACRQEQEDKARSLKVKNNQKRTREEFEFSISKDFLRQPDLQKNSWPKYIGSFQASAWCWHHPKVRRISKAGRRMIALMMENNFNRGYALNAEFYDISQSKGLFKTLNLDQFKIPTYITCPQAQGLLFAELDHAYSEIWTFLAQMNYITLKLYVAEPPKDLKYYETWEYKQENCFEVLIDVYLNEDFIKNTISSAGFNDMGEDDEEEEEEIKNVKKNKQKQKNQSDSDEDEDDMNNQTKLNKKNAKSNSNRASTSLGQGRNSSISNQSNQKSQKKPEERRKKFKELPLPEKENLWEQEFTKHMKEINQQFIKFMNLKISTPSMIKYKKKNQFKLLTKVDLHKPRSIQKIAKMIFKSKQMENYYENCEFLQYPLRYCKLYEQTEKKKKATMSYIDKVQLIEINKKYDKTCPYNPQMQERIQQMMENENQSDQEINSEISLQDSDSLIDEIQNQMEMLTDETNQNQMVDESQNIVDQGKLDADKINERLSSVHESKFYFQTPTPQTMRSELFDYQKQGLSWLLYREGRISKKQLFYDHPEVFIEDRELNPFYEEVQLPDGYKFYHNVLSGQVSGKFVKALHTFGGILADQMGLGKTLMSLALIHSDLIQRKKDGGYGTLIIVPLPTLTQWIRQIELHSVRDSIKVLNFHDKEKREDDISKYDVVICPYNLLASQYDRNKNGPLFNQQWRRIILDEAQKIKNRTSSIAMGAFRLQSDYRWCLSGTPIENKLDDIFSLLHFLKVETFGEWFWWNTYINSGGGCNNTNVQQLNDQFDLLHQVIKPLILRRTKVSTDKEGKDIITLPKKNILLEEVELTSNERKLYDLIHKSSEAIFKQLSQANQVQNNYIHIFQIISKLRQFCVHPSLVFQDISEEKIQNADLFKSKIEDFLNKNSLRNQKAMNQSNQMQPSSNSLINENSQKRQSSDSNLKENLNDISDEYKQKVIDEIKEGHYNMCQVCFGEIFQHAVSSCLHVLCSTCFKQSVKQHGKCPLCRKQLALNELLILDVDVLKNSNNISDTSIQDFNNPTQLTGSKMMKIIELIEKIRDKKEKVVVFSQWLGTMNILQQHLYERNIEFEIFLSLIFYINQRLDGNVKNKEKERILLSFEREKGEREDNVVVLLASIKSTYVGLNLVAANNVILCDSWWNPAVEDQAIERVHRIGQEKEVFVWRVICKKTVEERVLQLHEQKRKLISNALSCTESGRQEGAISDLQFLLGD